MRFPSTGVEWQSSSVAAFRNQRLFVDPISTARGREDLGLRGGREIYGRATRKKHRKPAVSREPESANGGRERGFSAGFRQPASIRTRRSSGSGATRSSRARAARSSSSSTTSRCRRPWSQLATNVVVSKYFRGPLGTPQRETSVRQLIGARRRRRSARGASRRATSRPPDDADVFADELTHLLLHQKACFNSPVWFNVGVEAKPQCSACFILSVDDTMDSILDWYRKRRRRSSKAAPARASTCRASARRRSGSSAAARRRVRCPS